MSDLKLFFATDIHGSEVSLRKFLNAAHFYKADVILMGGDITGKMIIPVVREAPDRFRATVFGHEYEVDSTGLPPLRKLISDAGYYVLEAEPDEVVQMTQHPELVEATFRTVMEATLTRWLDMADERLGKAPVMCIFAPGNDDPPFIDDVLRRSGSVVDSERSLVELPGGFSLISVGYSNPTPWKSPRELSEEALGAMIDEEAVKVPDMAHALFNLHVPPLETPLDQAMKLDGEFRPVLRGGSPVIGGVGSSAVRAAIEKYQPMMSLHGHIHESRGGVKLGRTTCINPGSEYSEGVLRGALVTLSKKRGLVGYQLVSG